MLTDEELLIAAGQFHREALVEIYDRYQGPLYAYAYRTLLDPVLAEECIATTFQRFLEILRKGKGPTHELKAYLYRIAHNWMMDWFRHASKEQKISDTDETTWVADGKSPADILGDKLTHNELVSRMRLLTNEQREVLVLRFLEDYSLVETAAILKKPIGAVKSLQYRALEALRRMEWN